jgi:hypothetical protein
MRPILIVLNHSLKDGSPVLQKREDPVGVKIQIDFPADIHPESPLFERTFLRALLLELGTRPGKSDTAEEPVNAPAWLVDALLHRFHHTHGTTSPQPLRSALGSGSWEVAYISPRAGAAVKSLRPELESGKIPGLSQILTHPEGAPSSAGLEKYGSCLLALLASQPEAAEGFRRLLQTSWENQSEPLATLRRLFPSLASSDADLQRVWTLHLASIGTQNERLTLSGEQTLRELNGLMEIALTDSGGRHQSFRLDQFSDYLRLPGIRAILMARHLELLSLRGRGHFLYAEAIQTIASVCEALAHGHTLGQAKRLRSAVQTVEQATVKIELINSYLDEAEADAERRKAAQAEAAERERRERVDPAMAHSIDREIDAAKKRLEQEASEADIERALRESRARSKKMP